MRHCVRGSGPWPHPPGHTAGKRQDQAFVTPESMSFSTIVLLMSFSSASRCLFLSVSSPQVSRGGTLPLSSLSPDTGLLFCFCTLYLGGSKMFVLEVGALEVALVGALEVKAAVTGTEDLETY